MGTIALRNCAVAACQSSKQRLPPVHRRDSGACQDTRRSSRLCATTFSTDTVSPDSMSLPKLNPVEPPWYGPVCPVVWEGRRRETPPYPDQSPVESIRSKHALALTVPALDHTATVAAAQARSESVETNSTYLLSNHVMRWLISPRAAPFRPCFAR
jgi:hypothetical protein